MNFPKIMKFLWHSNPQQQLHTSAANGNMAEVSPGSAESIMGKVGELLDKLPNGGGIELSETTIATKEPQAALKVGVQQGGVDARLSTNQQYTKRIILKVNKR